MRDQITNYVQACPTCQRNKRKVKKYGWLPPKEAEATPWDKMCIDLIGPYTIRRKEKRISYASVSPWLTQNLVGLKSTNMMIKSPVQWLI